jgi:hypothetical protein
LRLGEAKMGDHHEVAYYRRRAIEHLSMAKVCTNEQVKHCHLQFAEAYQRRMKEIETEERRSAFRVVKR